MLDAGTVLDIGDHRVEVMANPASTGDRYVLRIEAEPGGPGIKGDFPHKHPSLVETFKCLSGDMVIKAERRVSPLAVGDTVTVAPGVVHGFLNTGSTLLVVESEVIFPDGYRAGSDLLIFASVYDRMRREGPVNKRTGEPPILQMAVLTHSYGHVIRQPGIAGALMPLLAGVGRLAGYRERPFQDG